MMLLCESKDVRLEEIFYLSKFVPETQFDPHSYTTDDTDLCQHKRMFINYI